jgi:predicted Co/Zn/Cd cation transporter (cation efflux family)
VRVGVFSGGRSKKMEYMYAVTVSGVVVAVRGWIVFEGLIKRHQDGLVEEMDG